jgi:hypothetical protein
MFSPQGITLCGAEVRAVTDWIQVVPPNQQNQQLNLVGGFNAINSRDLEIGGRVRSPSPLPAFFTKDLLIPRGAKGSNKGQ